MRVNSACIVGAAVLLLTACTSVPPARSRSLPASGWTAGAGRPFRRVEDATEVELREQRYFGELVERKRLMRRPAAARRAYRAKALAYRRSA